MTRNTNEPTVPEDHTTFEHPILGQEAICPRGLGRVSNFCDHYPEQRWIEVTTYTDNYTCRWDPANVTLVPIPGVDKGTNASLVRQVSELKEGNARLSAHTTELREKLEERKQTTVKRIEELEAKNDRLRESNNRMKLAANKSWLERQTDKGTVYLRLTRVLDELFPEALRCQPTTDHALDVFDRHGLSLTPTENQS